LITFQFGNRNFRSLELSFLGTFTPLIFWLFTYDVVTVAAPADNFPRSTTTLCVLQPQCFPRLLFYP